MKSFLLILSALSVSVLSTAAQVTDAPPHLQAQPRSENYPDKAFAYGEYCGYALNASANDDNGNVGVMFKVRAKTNLVISGFSVILSGNPGYIRIYRKSGDYSGFENSPASWTLIDSAFTSPITGQQVFVPVNAGNSLISGSEMSYYIVGNSSTGVRYLGGTTEGAVFSQNEDLIFYEGVGISNNFGTVFSPRILTGTIHYCKQSEIRCDSSMTQFGLNNSNKGIFFDVTAKSQHIQIDNIFGDFDLAGGAMLKIYTREGTFAGNETNAAAWTLVDSSFISFPQPFAPEAVTDTMSLVVNAQSTRAFHIVFSNTGFVNYNNGTAMGDIVFEDSLLQIKTGAGADDPFVSNGLPRNFQGVISYCLMEYAGLSGPTGSTLRTWPNPATDQLNIHTGDEALQYLEILDINGRVLMQYHNFSGNSIPLHTLSPGTYILKGQNSRNVYTARFIKQ